MYRHQSISSSEVSSILNGRSATALNWNFQTSGQEIWWFGPFLPSMHFNKNLSYYTWFYFLRKWFTLNIYEPYLRPLQICWKVVQLVYFIIAILLNFIQWIFITITSSEDWQHCSRIPLGFVITVTLFPQGRYASTNKLYFLLASGSKKSR